MVFSVNNGVLNVKKIVANCSYLARDALLARGDETSPAQNNIFVEFVGFALIPGKTSPALRYFALDLQ